MTSIYGAILVVLAFGLAFAYAVTGQQGLALLAVLVMLSSIVMLIDEPR